MENSIFMKMQLLEKVKLEPAFISKGYRDEVLKRLKLKVEGICTKHGYIRPDSIELYKVCTGRVELIGLNGNTVFDVYFWADVCNPLLGSVIRCRVSNVNKFGILAEAGSIIEAIVAKNSVNIVSDVDLEKIRIGDEVMIEVVGKKYELNDKKISLIGKIVKNNDLPKPSVIEGGANTKKVLFDNDNDEEEDIEELVASIDGGSGSEADDEEDDENELEEEIDDDIASEAESDINSVRSDSKDNGNFFSDDEGYFSDFEEDFEEDADDDADEA